METLNRCLCLEGLLGESLVSLEKKKPKNIKAHLKFVNLHLTKPQEFSSDVIWTDDTTVSMFGRNTQHHI